MNKFCVALCTLFIVGVYSQSIPAVSRTNMQRDSTIQFVDTEVAFVLATTTSSGRLLRTIDGGKNWTDVTDQLENLNSNYIIGFIVNVRDHTKVFLAGSGTTSWYSLDRGVTWNAVNIGATFIDVQYHPHQNEWALGLSNEYNLYVTRDGGKTWSRIQQTVIGYNWGDAGSGDVPLERVYFIQYDRSQGIPYNLMYSDDWCATNQILLPHAYQIVFTRDHLLAPIYMPVANEISLQITPDLGRKYKTFYEAEFPFGDQVENKQYAIIDDSTGGLYIGINHVDLRTGRWGNIYTSDSTGARYVLSLEHVKLLPLGSDAVLYDFDPVRSLEGIFMANVLTNWESSTSDQYDKIQTFSTLNNGAKWQRLNPPHFDSNGNPIHCSGECYLHLHGYTSFVHNINQFYSTPSAVGLVIGTGNVGEFLTTDESQLNTYMSRDGGLTWIELRKGSSIYEIGDHGGIIALAPYGTPTDTIYYTLDYGTTGLIPFKFSEEAVEIDNIITEPKSTTEVFIVLSEHAVFSLDFYGIFTRTCDRFKDYEHFTPTAGRTALGQEECLMGRSVTYQRRNATSECYYDEQVDMVVSTVNCACTEDDYECDYHYSRDLASGQCKLDAGVSPAEYPPQNCPEDSDYYKTRGYRLEPGNSCQAGVDHRPEGPFECPSSVKSLTGNKGWIAAVVLIPLVVLAILGTCLAMRSEKLREKIPFLKVMASWKVGYFHVQPDTALVESDDENPLHDKKEEHSDEEHGNFVVGTGLDEEDNKKNDASKSFFDPQ